MNRKPTYNELGKKVPELQWSKNAIQRSEARLKEGSFSGIIGRDPKMKDIFDMIKEISEAGEKAAPEKNWWPGRYITKARGRIKLSYRSIAAHFPKDCSKASFSVM
jgi:hypothetical protein